MPEYTKEELAALHKINMDMAKYFVDFCNKNGLMCYFCGGGCIGAVRHKGFIPWDDDLDFFMPRDDYEKLYKLWNNDEQERYKLSKPGKDTVDRNLFITIRDSETTLIKPYQQDLDMVHGVVLDILPLDGYPSSSLSRKWQVIHALIYSLFCAQTVPEKHGGLMAVGSKILLGIFRGKNIRYKIWKRAERKMTKYKIADCDSITELCSGPGYMKKKYPKSAFEKALFVDFEDTKMPIPVGYDDYLKIAFGDYMKLPPKEKQVAHHDVIKLDCEHSYKIYKGKYYLIGKGEEK